MKDIDLIIKSAVSSPEILDDEEEEDLPENWDEILEVVE